MRNILFTFLLVSTISFSQEKEQLNGEWIAFTDSSENLMYLRDTIEFTIHDEYKETGCVYHVHVNFRKDTSAFIWPEWSCRGKNWGNNSPYIPRGMLFIPEDGVICWQVELWIEDVEKYFYGNLYYNYTIEDKELTLIRDRSKD